MAAAGQYPDPARFNVDCDAESVELDLRHVFVDAGRPRVEQEVRLSTISLSPDAAFQWPVIG